MVENARQTWPKMHLICGHPQNIINTASLGIFIVVIFCIIEKLDNWEVAKFEFKIRVPAIFEL